MSKVDGKWGLRSYKMAISLNVETYVMVIGFPTF
jgi:hypothetical protein